MGKSSGVRVLCVGPPKSGTSTLHRAFEESGLCSSHGSMAPVQMWQAFVEGRAPLFYVNPEIEAITDPHITRPRQYNHQTIWPTCSPAFMECFVRHHPDVWVLLNTRSFSSWIDSVNRWKDLRKRIVKADLPFLPSGEGKTDNALIGWIQCYYERIRGMDIPKFLEVAIEDPQAPEKIGEALGIKLKWWGVENVNEN